MKTATLTASSLAGTKQIEEDAKEQQRSPAISRPLHGDELDWEGRTFGLRWEGIRPDLRR